MTAPDKLRLIETGCALIVGLVTPEGRPFATRGCGFDLPTADRPARLLFNARDVDRTGIPLGLEVDLGIAVTGADIADLSSVQVKGRLRRIDNGTPEDLARAQRYMDEFIGAVGRNDGFPADLMARWVPTAVHAATLELHAAFDQTPGPGAGCLLRSFGEEQA